MFVPPGPDLEGEVGAAAGEGAEYAVRWAGAGGLGLGDVEDGAAGFWGTMIGALGTFQDALNRCTRRFLVKATDVFRHLALHQWVD